MNRTPWPCPASLRFKRSRRLSAVFIGALALVLLGVSAASAGIDHEVGQRVEADEGQNGACFGNAVALSGNTGIVGAVLDDATGANNSEEGAAYIVQRSPDNSWDDVKKLNAGEGAQNRENRFGQAVDIDGDDAIVGANQASDGEDFHSGKAYIFSRDAGGSGQWAKTATLTITEGGNRMRYLGWSVAIEGDFAYVGAVNAVDDPDDPTVFSGAVYVFERNTGGANNWGVVKRIVADDPTNGERFGASLDVDGDRLIVGSVPNGRAGAAYIFDRQSGGSNNWGQVAKLVPNDVAGDDEFGLTVAINGDVAVVGSPKDDDDGENSGSAYLYQNSGVWSQSKKITASDAAAGRLFGFSVDMSVDKLVVGAPGGFGEASSTYLFEQDFGGFGQWGEAVRYIPDLVQSESLGASVAIDNLSPSFFNVLSGTSLYDTAPFVGDACSSPNVQGGSAFVLSVPFTGPVTTPDEYTATAGQQLQVAAPGVLGNDTDIGSGPLFVAEISGDGTTVENGSVELASDGSFVYTPPVNFTGVDRFLYLVWDGAAKRRGAAVSITVDPAPPVNEAPVVDAGLDQTITLPATAVLDGSVTDDGLPVDPGSVTTLWAKVFGPGDVTFADAGATSTTAEFSVAGVYVLGFRADDGELDASDAVTITVNPAAPVNEAPVVDAGLDQTITLPATAILDGSVTDDGLPVDPGSVTTLWAKVSGPGDVTFADAGATSTTVEFSVDGVYVLGLAGDDGELETIDELTVTVDPAAVSGLAERLFVSSSSAGVVDGVGFTSGDILEFDVTNNTWSLFFDGSAAGLGTANVDGFHIVDPGPTAAVIQLTLAGPTTIAGLGTVDDSDIIVYSGGTGAGASGTLSVLFDGSDVGLSAGGEDIDALSFDGVRPVLSVLGTAAVPHTGGGTLRPTDEDLIGFDGTTGPSTSGTFQRVFDGSDVGFNADLVSVWVDPTTDEIFGSSLNGFNIGGLSGDGDDVFVFTGTTGQTTSGTFELYFDGDEHRFGGEQIDGLHIIPGSPPPPGSADLAITIADDAGNAALAGDNVTFTVGVTNNGPDPAMTVTVTNTLPPGLTFVSTAGCGLDPDGLPCSLGTIDVGETASFSVAATVDAGTLGTVTNKVAATSGTADPVPANNTASTDLLVSGPPQAVADGPESNSTPGSLFHTDIDTAYALAGPGVLANDTLGSPAGSVTSFGGGDLGGTAADTPAGQTAAAAGGGSLQVNADGSFTFTPGSGFSGPFSFQYRLENLGGVSDADVTVYVGPRPVAAGNLVYVSSAGSGTVDGIGFEDEDIMVYNTVTDEWSMFFDGSDVGLAVNDINGFTIESVDPTVIHLTLTAQMNIPGIIGQVDDSDVITFNATSTGETTAGTFELLIDGSDLGLSSGGEDIDALTTATGADLVFSTWGSHNAGGVAGSDEDLLALAVTGTGPVTSGTLSVLFDGSDVDLTAEDISAASIDPETGDIYGATLGGFNVTGLTGDNDDIFVFTGSTGAATAGTYSTFFDGDAARYSNQQIDGLHIAPENLAPTITSPAAASVAENQTAVLDVQTTDDKDDESDGLIYTLSRGADDGLFAIDAGTGVVTFASAPDFEAPEDANGDNVYEIVVTVTDSGGLTDTRAITVTVTDVPEASFWARGMGSDGSDLGREVAVDAAGNSYITGSFRGTTDFDPGAGVSELTSNGTTDVFVVKLDPNGDLVWVRSMGGAGVDQGFGIAVDAAGNSYTTGFYSGTVDFDPGVGVTEVTSNGENDVFVVKLDSDGDLVWAKGVGGPSFDQPSGIGVDSAGNSYATGRFRETADFDPGPGVMNLSSNGEHDVFVVKLDSDGDLVWARGIGGADTDRAGGIAVDAAGNSYATGSFRETVDFDPGAGVANVTSNGDADVFVLKLDSGGDLLWVKGFGDTDADRGFAVGVDAAGNSYATGLFVGVADFDPGAGVANLTSSGGPDAFVVKLDPDGDFVWARNMGGTDLDFGNGIAVDDAGNPHVTGFFYQVADFDPGAGVANLTSNGGADVFVVKLDSDGDLVWARSMGSTSNDRSFGIAIDADGQTYSTGSYRGTVDFDPGAGVTNLTSNGSDDIFVLKLDQNGDLS